MTKFVSQFFSQKFLEILKDSASPNHPFLSKRFLSGVWGSAPRHTANSEIKIAKAPKIYLVISVVKAARSSCK